MEQLFQEQERLEKKGNLGKAVSDVQKTIDLLISARDTISADPASAPTALDRLQNPVRQSLDKINDDLKDVRGAQNKFQKALEKKFKDKPLPTASDDALAAHPTLVNRAIAMHFLREGQFDVASTFIQEANTKPPLPAAVPPPPPPTDPENLPSAPDDPPTPPPGPTAPHADRDAWATDFADGTVTSESLRRRFAEMYHILGEMRQRRNLAPAIAWARRHSDALEARASNLEFELVRLRYVRLFLDPPDEDEGMGDDDVDGQGEGDYNPSLRARAYALKELTRFGARYDRDIVRLCGALPYWPNLRDSPHWRPLFASGAGGGGGGDDMYEEVAASFTREFCSLLGLSAQSPLYVAVTAGAMALPTLLKLQAIMKEKRTEWTTREELPVETPLPPAYHFHSIFVCPVSKEQGTDANPPMMMPCGHVIAKQSLETMSRGPRFKCPYCPHESLPRDARKVFL